MYPVTQDFLDKVRATERRVFGRIQIDYTDPFIDQSIQVQTSEQANVSFPAQTADAVSEPFAKIASLDGSWVLDGSFALAPDPDEADTHQMGWWGSQLSQADGTFVQPYPSLTVTHFARPIHSLRVVGDSKRGEYPVDFRIDLYGPDDTLLYTENVVGNTEVAWSKTLASPVLDVVKQVLTITKWSHPGRQAKILEFFTSVQETYEGDDILLIHLLEEREVSQGSLPVGNISANEIDIRLNNESRKFDAGNTQSPLYRLLKQNRRIRAWLGLKGEDNGQQVSKMWDSQADWQAGLILPEIYLDEAGDIILKQYNLLPDFVGWELGGGAYINENGELVLPSPGAYARSPFIDVNYASKGYFSAEYWSDQESVRTEFKPDAGRLLNTEYYDANKQPTTNRSGYTGNGSARKFPKNQWWRQEWGGDGSPIGFDLGPNVKYVRVKISADTTWTSPSYKVRKPMLTTTGEWTPYGVYHSSGTWVSQSLDLTPVGQAATSRISWSADTPPGTSISVEASLDGGQTWAPCTNGGAIPGINVGDDLTGKSLLVRVTLSTTDTSVTPVLHSLTVEVNHEEWVPLGVFWSGDWSAPEDGVYAQTTGRDRLELLRKSTYSTSTVQQNKTLYDLAVAVLQDAGLKSDEYWVDTELQQYTIPYAYFEPMSHREALRLIAEACLGQVYCDRNGVIRVEGPSYLASKTTADLTITQDDYFRKDNPVRWGQIANYIEVETQPLRPDVSQEVYRSNDPISIAAGQTMTLTIYYNQTPCINASASLVGATNTVITAATYYAWGADITLKNNGTAAESVTIVINAQPLKIMNKEKAIAQDTQSITDNGLIRYTFPANPLVQTLSMAQTIANKLLQSFKDPRRDVEIEWRGNPALLLGDRVSVVDNVETNDYFVIRQEIEYDGALRAKLSGRRAI